LQHVDHVRSDLESTAASSTAPRRSGYHRTKRDGKQRSCAIAWCFAITSTVSPRKPTHRTNGACGDSRCPSLSTS